tara:strand:+ start:37 stop:201 length:165 start_codon:yes stop_codon:yes gene_type:complete
LFLTNPDDVYVEKVLSLWQVSSIKRNKSFDQRSGFLEGENPSKNQASTFFIKLM